MSESVCVCVLSSISQNVMSNQHGAVGPALEVRDVVDLRNCLLRHRSGKSCICVRVLAIRDWETAEVSRSTLQFCCRYAHAASRRTQESHSIDDQ
jgi:hypothetical protein